MAKNEDPWHPDNIKKTLEERANQLQNLNGTLAAMDGELKAKVARAIREHSEGDLPDYEIINQASDKYNADVANEVRGIIEAHYDTDNDLSPLNKAFDKAKADDLSKELVRNLYHSTVDQMIRDIGKKDYHQVLEGHQDRNRNKVQNDLSQAASAGYNEQLHGDAVVDHFLQTYNIDESKINRDALRNKAAGLISTEAIGRLTADAIYNEGPNYKRLAGKKEHKYAA